MNWFFPCWFPAGNEGFYGRECPVLSTGMFSSGSFPRGQESGADPFSARPRPQHRCRGGCQLRGGGHGRFSFGERREHGSPVWGELRLGPFAFFLYFADQVCGPSSHSIIEGRYFLRRVPLVKLSAETSWYPYSNLSTGGWANFDVLIGYRALLDEMTASINVPLLMTMCS